MDDSGVKTAGFFQNPKVVFGFILFLVVVGVGMGAYRFASGIRGGFVAQRKVENTNLQPLVADSQENEALKQRDTDGDGLNDYEELYLYRTSPYLADTDSDGLEDKVEIDKEKDPNCPEGQSCKQFVPPAQDQNQESGIMNQEPDSLLNVGGDGGAVGDSTGEIDTSDTADTSDMTDTTDTSETLDSSGVAGGGLPEEVRNLSASEIRDLLLQSGKITQEQLDAIDDETLMRVYREVIAKQ